MLVWDLVGLASVVAWIYLVFARGAFWRMREAQVPKLNAPKSVAVVVPARNEEPVIGQAIGSLVQQNYPGPFHIFLVDDHSGDATIAGAGKHERLTIVSARPLPDGWTGKLWAISEGFERATSMKPDYILLTDADIVHATGNIAGLVARAEKEDLDLVSYMVKLKCQTLAERALIPAFVFFFFMLHPPAWINRRERSTAGAAGGCILLRSSVLERIGGIAAIRGELIDDCALARRVKLTGGRIWLGLTSESSSIRDYQTFGEIHRMIARTAFTQLGYSTALLIGTIFAMTMVYLAPPLLILTRQPIAVACGASAWLLMIVAYLPTLRFYGRTVFWAPALPLVALFYMIATINSAARYWSGRGGLWKGRVQVARD
jgi:hopene-associated glycosyltransferase HpnB